ncbi:hypothetical protein DFQ30_010689 [Apophysomyces sp. BC1015]|nr:hypothetical protein DFQ30_010689 [Apophysomyces sp. BC1015]
MKCAGLSPSSDQSALARMVGGGCKPQNVQYLLDPNRNAKSSRYTVQFAEVLNCDPAWLAYGTGRAPTLRVLNDKPRLPFKAGVRPPPDAPSIRSEVKMSLVERSSCLAQRFMAAVRDGSLTEDGVNALEQTFGALTRARTVSLKMKESDLDAQSRVTSDEQPRRRMDSNK